MIKKYNDKRKKANRKKNSEQTNTAAFHLRNHVMTLRAMKLTTLLNTDAAVSVSVTVTATVSFVLIYSIFAHIHRCLWMLFKGDCGRAPYISILCFHIISTSFAVLLRTALLLYPFVVFFSVHLFVSFRFVLYCFHGCACVCVSSTFTAEYEKFSHFICNIPLAF